MAAVYDLLYLFRRSGKALPTMLGDLLFVLCVFVSVAYVAWEANAGALHGYFLIGSLLGFSLGRAVWGFFLKKMIDFFAGICYNLIKKIKNTRVAHFLRK